MIYYTVLIICALVSLVVPKSILPVKCGPVCDIYCQYGNVLDANGCPTCSCKKSPCAGGQVPLAGYFCGRGPNRQDCPASYKCVIAPNDAYAVCCRRCKQVVTKPPEITPKPGSCPPSSGLIGICIARCTTDNDCEGDQKCCGSCPRECVKAIF